MHRDAGGRDRKPREQRRPARDVAGCRHTTGDDVLNFGRIGLGARHGMLHRMAEHRHVRGVVEPASGRFRQARPGIRDDDCLTHRRIPFLVPPQSARSLVMRHPGEEHMAATVQSKSNDIVADMNTTPLIDVMLVLLTLLIITLPMQTHAIKIDTGHGTPPPIQPQTVNLSIDFDGTTSWNGAAISHATLDAYLADAARKSPQPDIVIRADRL